MGLAHLTVSCPYTARGTAAEEQTRHHNQTGFRKAFFPSEMISRCLIFFLQITWALQGLFTVSLCHASRKSAVTVETNLEAVH